jgi:plasmid stabilization system protein ParE
MLCPVQSPKNLQEAILHDSLPTPFPVGNYLIFFRPIQDGIEVIGVLHGKRNITGRFF